MLRALGLAALVALVLELLLLSLLLPLDAAVWQAILSWRSCDTDRMVGHVAPVATSAAIALLGAAAVLRVRRGGVLAAWPPLALCAVGLLAGKVLKNAFARERPSMLPDLALGHSFPSGHVMNTALAALAVMVLAAGFRRPRRWAATAVALLAVVTAGRLLVAHHWFLDAVGGMLAALALTGLCLPPFRRRPVLAPAVVAVALTAVLALDVKARALEIRLPSPLVAQARTTVEVSPRAPLDTRVWRGAWDPAVDRFPRPHAWLRGAGTVTMVLADVGFPGGAQVATARRAPGVLFALAGRPDVGREGCVHVAITVNGHALSRFVAFVGWRQYRAEVPDAVLRLGPNEVRLDARDDHGRPASFAVEYLRLADATGAGPGGG